MNTSIRIGAKAERTYEVQDQHTAKHVGSGSLRVLATPWLIAFMERVAREMIQDSLQDGSTSVGTHVDVNHLAATPVGCQVRVTCTVLTINGRRIEFAVEAWDKFEKVGEGRHERVVIDESRFLKRLDNKLSDNAR